MNLRTLKLIAQWITQQTGVNIKFVPGVVPCANAKAKTILLPTQMDENGIYAGIALIMHEAGHIRYSGALENNLKTVCQDAVDKELCNALEDTRIDRKMIRILPATREFYTDLAGCGWDKCDISKIPKSRIALLMLMDKWLGIQHNYTQKFAQYAPPYAQFNEISNAFSIALSTLECVIDYGNRSWDEFKQKLAELRKAMGIKPPEPKPKGDKGDEQGESVGKGEGTSEGEGEEQEGQEEGKNTNGQQKGSDEKQNKRTGGKDTGEKGEGTAVAKANDTDNQDDIAKAKGRSVSLGDVFGVGKSELEEKHLLSYEAFEEQTKRELKERLNIKEIRRVSDGQMLDSDNLVAFFSGDVEELFKDDRIVKRKKSKVLFLLDSSYSMDDTSFGKSKRDILVGAMKGILECLDEVIELEGINVEYQVDAFDDQYHHLNQDKWASEYYGHGGGTRIDTAFSQALDSIANDYTISGKRIFIVFSDGEVYDWQVENVKKKILESGVDVRMMIIGIGSTKKEFRELIGEHNILLNEESQTVISEAIKECL